MNREIKKSYGTERIPTQRLTSLLETFGLRHASESIVSLLEEADMNGLTAREFLFNVLETEIKGRNSCRRARNLASAHFPPNAKPLDEFDPSELESGITATQIRSLREFSWVDSHSNLVFSGPPGLGKTMVACGLGLEAVECGYTVCFEKMASLARMFDAPDTDRTSSFRLKAVRRCQLLIIDEVGYTPITRAQATKLFTLISDRYETGSILFTTNKEIADWTELMGDPVLTAAMLDRILQHGTCFAFRGESYRLKHADPLSGQRTETIEDAPETDPCDPLG